MTPINTQTVLRNLGAVLRTRDIAKLSRTGYTFLSLMSGFIAHYDLQGFRAYYANVDDLALDIAESCDLAGAERYITDSLFTSKDAAYYRSKYETLAGLRELVAAYSYPAEKRDTKERRV
jgi:hypothetical protein